MIISSIYESYNDAEEIVANESYDDLSGAVQVALEGIQFEREIFHTIVEQDMHELATKYNPELVSESAFETLLEANGTGIWGKIVAFIEKIGEKLKGILKALIAKLDTVFMRDNKVLWKKYSKDIYKKVANGGFSKFKYKWADSNTVDIITGEAIVKDGLFTTGTKGLFSEIKARMAFDINKDNDVTGRGNTNYRGVKTGGQDENNKDQFDDSNKSHNDKIKELTDEQVREISEATYGLVVGSGPVSKKEFTKAFDEHVFKDIEEKEGLSSSDLSRVETVLTSIDKVSTNLKKLQTKVDRGISTLKTDAQKKQTEINKLFGDKANHTLGNKVIMAKSRDCSKLLSAFSSVSSDVFMAVNAAIKKEIKQNRALVAKIMAYNPKSPVDETTVLFDAIDEATDFEMDNAVTSFAI